MTDIAIAISVSKKHMMIYFVFSNYHQCCSSKLSKSLPKVDCYEPNIFFFFFIDRTAEDLDRKKGEREGERHAAKGLRPGVELQRGQNLCTWKPVQRSPMNRIS